jgi:glycosyltransferase involved in cell wall biosynthesis
MKILWITNTLFPAACKKLGIPIPFVGGWMYSSAEYLLKYYGHIELSVASLYTGKEFVKFIGSDGITYFLLPRSTLKYKYDVRLEAYWKEIKNQFAPDIIHLHGTEYPHGLAYVNACGSANVVVSIQGIVNIIERYYYGGINEKDLRWNLTFRDLVKSDSIIQQRSKLQKQGEYEKLLIKKVQHIIGRTSWDKAHVWAINPKANYHFSNETLRGEFYKHSWSQINCKKYQILLSQSHYPLKGLHQMIKALPLILNYYPDVRIIVAGNNFIKTKSILRLSGYGKYIRSLMKSVGVEEKIIFTGPLSENEMCKKYLESNVFVCPSSIENSSNSIGEAQLLGVPCIASFVGGTSDMIINNQTGLLYRFEEIEMLAMAVCRIFSDNDFANSLSKNEIEAALHRHDKQNITENLNFIYKSICSR